MWLQGASVIFFMTLKMLLQKWYMLIGENLENVDKKMMKIKIVHNPIT